MFNGSTDSKSTFMTHGKEKLLTYFGLSFNDTSLFRGTTLSISLCILLATSGYRASK